MLGAVRASDQVLKPVCEQGGYTFKVAGRENTEELFLLNCAEGQDSLSFNFVWIFIQGQTGKSMKLFCPRLIGSWSLLLLSSLVVDLWGHRS